jgi:putative membrane protein
MTMKSWSNMASPAYHDAGPRVRSTDPLAVQGGAARPDAPRYPPAMRLLGLALVALVALLHLCFMVLEMFLWRTRARRVFRMSAEKAEATAQLAANQGLYNGFLAAGLVWALASGPELLPRATFFLLCVVAAGVYGSVSVQRTILYVQAVPAALALAALWASR